MVATGFALPFRFMYSQSAGLSDKPLAIRIRTAGSGEAGQVVAAVGLFARLAGTGALGGIGQAPWDACFACEPGTAGDPRDLLFRVSSCRLAPEAWIVLCHLLLSVHRSLPLEFVEIRQPGDPYPIGLAQSDSEDSSYPRVYAPLPFLLDDLQPEGGGYSFLITLRAPLSPDNETRLNDWLATWVRAVQGGAYALAPDVPESDYVEPDGEIVAYETTVEWAVFKLRADPVAAIDALLNILCRFHVLCQPLLSVEIG